MSQHDFDIANQGFAAFRADLNNALKALGSLSSGTAEPATTYANQLWYETDTNTLHIRNEANSAWLDLMVIDQTTGSPSFTAGNVGIGTSSPSQKLHVAGAVYATGDGSDVALYMDGSDAIRNTSNGGVTYHDVATGSAAHGQFVFRSSNALTERLRLDASGNLGLGTATPVAKLTVAMDTASLSVGNLSTDVAQIGVSSVSDSIAFGQFVSGGATFNEKARIDANGNLLVGTTNTTPGTGDTDVGCSISGGGFMFASREGGVAAYFNRNTSDGGIVQFNKNGTTVGSIGSRSGATMYVDLYPGVSGITGSTSGGQNSVSPTAGNGVTSDNTVDLGAATIRWDDVYATNGTIQTSDANEKQDIEELSEAEQRVAVACKGLMRKYRWKDAVAEKGDDARIHFGIIAQDLQAAFAAEGLDAGRYAMFIHSTWTDEETGEERSRMGVRYTELLAFMIAAL